MSDDTTPRLPPIVDEHGAELVRMYCDRLAASDPADGTDEARLLRQFRRALEIYEDTQRDLDEFGGLGDFTPRERLYSFRLQKGRERIAELELDIAQRRESFQELQDRIAYLETALVDMTEQRDQHIANLTREWSAHAQTRTELAASRRAHEAALVKLKAIENALLDRHAHATVRVLTALEVLR